MGVGLAVMGVGLAVMGVGLAVMGVSLTVPLEEVLAPRTLFRIIIPVMAVARREKCHHQKGYRS